LEIVATGNETVGKVSSFPGANTLFEGQHIEERTDREMRKEEKTHTEKRDTEGRNRREIEDEDQGRSKQQIRRGTRTAPRHNVRGS
jgi:hypothetical protein